MSKKPTAERKKYLQSVADAWNNLEAFPTHQAVAEKLGVPKDSLRRLVRNARDAGIKCIQRVLVNTEIKKHETRTDNQLMRENLTLKQQVKKLREQLEASQEDTVSNEKLIRIIRNAAETPSESDLSWLTYKSKGDSSKSVPVLFLSDLHFDEVVEPSQVEYVNSYNREIAVKRIQTVFNNSLDLLTRKLKNKYAGCIVALGGDLLSGNIHEELAETNGRTRPLSWKASWFSPMSWKPVFVQWPIHSVLFTFLVSLGTMAGFTRSRDSSSVFSRIMSGLFINCWQSGSSMMLASGSTSQNQPM